MTTDLTTSAGVDNVVVTKPAVIAAPTCVCKPSVKPRFRFSAPLLQHLEEKKSKR